MPPHRLCERHNMLNFCLGCVCTLYKKSKAVIPTRAKGILPPAGPCDRRVPSEGCLQMSACCKAAFLCQPASRGKIDLAILYYNFIQLLSSPYRAKNSARRPGPRIFADGWHLETPLERVVAINFLFSAREDEPCSRDALLWLPPERQGGIRHGGQKGTTATRHRAFHH